MDSQRRSTAGFVTFFQSDRGKAWLDLDAGLQVMKQALAKRDLEALSQKVLDVATALQTAMIGAGKIRADVADELLARLQCVVRVLEPSARSGGGDWPAVEAALTDFEVRVLELTDECAKQQDSLPSFARSSEEMSRVQHRSTVLRREVPEEEEYHSEFSDDEFSVEEAEEELACETIQMLIKAVSESVGARLLDMSRVLMKLAAKACEQRPLDVYSIKGILDDSELKISVLEYHALARGADLFAVTSVEQFAAFVESLRTRSARSWREKVRNRYFELKYRSFSLHRILAAADKAARNWLFDVIIFKVVETVKARVGDARNEASLRAYVDGFARAKPERFRPAEIRRALIREEFPLTREETKVILKLLEDEEGFVATEALISFLGNPDLHRLVREKMEDGGDLESSIREGAEGEELIRLLRGQQRTQAWKRERALDVFRMRDSLHVGRLSPTSFLSACRFLRWPLTSISQVESLSRHFHPNRRDIDYFALIATIFDERRPNEKENEVPSRSAEDGKYSTVRTLHMEADQLRMENQELRKTVSTLTQRINVLEQEKQALMTKKEESARTPSFVPRSDTQELVRRLEESERTILYRQIEHERVLRELHQSHSDNLARLQRSHSLEVSKLTQALAAKDTELDEFRDNIQRLLAEIEYLQKSTVRH
eukprot:TRINITY_DN5473_c0_g1_i2.p1 TRINITY_DN5473_c0_g1~~TRINITY_DN5473_c0_g1_i2.p1  ORF type:complete len:662 (-),score=131.53 TRINITY_DN5473_c0_g1_i2:15-2000(-)